MSASVKPPPSPDREASGAPPPSQQPPDDQLRMSLLGHLDELRRRAIRAGIAIGLGFIVGMATSGPVLQFLKQPYGANRFLVLGPTDSVVAYFRVALMVAGILAIPVITYQALMFIIPGLTAKERRYLLYSLPAVFGLFILGVIFTWVILIPPAVGFFDNFMPEVFVTQWTADRYLAFVTTLLFWMGVAFETPLIAFVLSLLGILTTKPLIHNWRIAVVGAAVAAAVITPTIDPINMMLVMGPLLGLYVLSIVLVTIGQRFAMPHEPEGAVT